MKKLGLLAVLFGLSAFTIGCEPPKPAAPPATPAADSAPAETPEEPAGDAKPAEEPAPEEPAK